MQELLRVHSEVVALCRERIVDVTSHPPTCPPERTYEELLEYQAFHFAYHAGQIYDTPSSVTSCPGR